jgi:hypothetical protein
MQSKSARQQGAFTHNNRFFRNSAPLSLVFLLRSLDSETTISVTCGSKKEKENIGYPFAKRAQPPG